LILDSCFILRTVQREGIPWQRCNVSALVNFRWYHFTVLLCRDLMMNLKITDFNLLSSEHFMLIFS
jgi:hypothetical protein